MSNNENFIIFSDVKQLFIRFKWMVLLGAILLGAVGFYARTQMAVHYEIVSTFKEANVASSHTGESFVSSMVKSLGGGMDQKGYYIITSSRMLAPVAQKLGLQVTSSEGNGWRKKWEQLRNAVHAEKGKPLPSVERFVFEDVVYDGEETQEFTLFFGSKESFEVRSPECHVLAKGKVGGLVQLEGMEFVLKGVPADLTLSRPYAFTISSLHTHVQALSEAIQVDAVKGDESLIKLTLNHSDRIFGKRLLNTLMEVYQSYIIGENERIAGGQIAYLEKRRDELCSQMHFFLEGHVAYLKESLGETGFLSLGQRLPLLQQRKNGFSEQLLGLNLEHDSLVGVKWDNAFGSNSEILALQQELHALTKTRDEIGLALIEKNSAPYLAKLSALDLEQVRIKTGVDTFCSHMLEGLGQQKKERDKTLLNLLSFGEKGSSEMDHLVKIQKEKKEVADLMRLSKPAELTTHYLNNQHRLLSIQESVLKQRLFHRTTFSDDFAGMDLITLKKLLINYLNERDSFLAQRRQLEFAKTQMEQEGVEWVSLAATLPDGISQEIALEMGKARQRMRQKGGVTEKEIHRMERTFSQKKGNLIKHIDQTIDLQQHQVDRLKERMTLVQMAVLDLLNQEITLIEQQVKDRAEQRLSQVKLEKELVQGQINGVLAEMKNVPEMWLKERELQFSSEMHKGMLESLIRLVESKNIENNLMSIESKPLDLAYASLIPKYPMLRLITLLGMMIGGFVTFGLCFIYTFYRGVPLTLENMRVRGRNVMGKLSSKHDVNLETLRNLSLLLKEQRSSSLVVSLVLGRGLNYSTSLATLLEKEGKNLLVIDLDFSNKIEQKNEPTLIHYLEGEGKEAPIKEKSYGAFLSMGGSTPYGDELLKGKRFHDFIHEMKEQYDIILLCMPKNAHHSLPKSFFSCSDVMALHLEDATFQTLLPYFKWEDGGGTVAFTSV